MARQRGDGPSAPAKHQATNSTIASNDGHLGDTVEPTRRPPFSNNPTVGVRGMHTQQSILKAALDMFGEVGYHACGVERITKAAGCSRPSFYQYFSSKEDVFRQLAGTVARRLGESTAALQDVTPDRSGWHELRDWLERYADIYDEYEAVFATFSTAAGSDSAVASGSERFGTRNAAVLARRMRAAVLFDTYRAESVVRVLLGAVARTNRYRDVLDRRSGSGVITRCRANDALADVLHRILFGLDDAVNVHRPPRGAARPAMTGAARPPVVAAADHRDLSPALRETRQKLIDAAAAVFVARGYHGTRVDDIVEAAGTSHGTFYRYFDNKGQLFRILALRAGTRVVAALDAVPDIAAAPRPHNTENTLREWLHRYSTTYVEEDSIIKVWVEAIARDAELSAVSFDAVEASRRRMAMFLKPRGFGDVDAEALVLLGLLDSERLAMSAPRSSEKTLDLVTDVIRRGFLGPDAPL